MGSISPHPVAASRQLAAGSRAAVGRKCWEFAPGVGQYSPGWGAADHVVDVGSRIVLLWAVVFVGWWVAIFRALLRFIEAQNSSPYFCAPMTGATREPERVAPVLEPVRRSRRKSSLWANQTVPSALLAASRPWFENQGYPLPACQFTFQQSSAMDCSIDVSRNGIRLQQLFLATLAHTLDPAPVRPGTRPSRAHRSVIPAQAGIQPCRMRPLDSRFRGNDSE
jgi:hypothetical protein